MSQHAAWMRQALSSRFQLFTYGRIFNTMDVAKSLIDNHDVHRSLGVIYVQQHTQARGRQGRVWVTGPSSLAVTVIGRATCNVQSISQLSIVSCVAVHQALSKLLTVPIQLKWPNDILIEHKKCGGILIELYKKENVLWIIIGCGFNLNEAPSDIKQTTYLNKHALYPLVKEHVFVAVCNAFLLWYDHWNAHGFERIKHYWHNHSLDKKTMVSCHRACGQQIQGYPMGINDQGHLLLQNKNGSTLTVHTGEIVCSR